jgi:tagatose 6-phosphate kinase
VILTVTLNPAIDLTYHVDVLQPGTTHRVSRVDERLGGKGLNVASVLEQLGEPVVATGLLRDGPATFTPIAATPRRTVVVADGRDATGFWEPGPVVTPQEWATFTTDFASRLEGIAVVVFSGSLPSGLPGHAYASLIELARSAGCRTILDTSGAALAHGIVARPEVVKPNASELRHLLSAASSPTASGAEAGFLLQPRAADRAESLLLGGTNPTVVVESHGPEGLRALGWRARPPRHIEGNPTGAGDACVAALARGLVYGTPWPDLLRDAVALSAAAVASPIAGHVDLELYKTLIPEVIVEEI